MAFKGQNVSLGIEVTADTSKAKRQLQDLKSSLESLTSSTLNQSNTLGITKGLEEGVTAANKLKIALEEATSSTGTLDLSAFNASISKSGLTINEYATKLSQLGPAGQKAFTQMASAVNTAAIPLKSTNSLLTSMYTSLVNVAKYQISTSVINAFTGAISSAVSYAEKLNTSLNKIQIVTGDSSTQMAKFAEKANQAAQKLSTTTTAYTDAALIFYQQGLDDDAVEERTNAVIKMAHATGDSATEVSSYMTAIWNNFDDGSESLEHYADVITALGASTASSSSEIAEGLSKFASVADTIGLSYDYATSALATLVANTRQSADTVGNSLKTIFSRLSSVSLGETLEDGVNLTKYTTALNKVGVQVLDTTGNLKDMDTILDDLAGKWDTLSNAEKSALAQTVGGTRQYTQLISLMDNWGDMQANLATAGNVNGTLDTQADIYAQSWEAAKDRVTAAAQEIYSALINDDFFITILDSTTGILNEISTIIKNLGGLKGALSAVGAIITQIFGAKISNALSASFQSLFTSTQKLRTSALETKNEVNKAAQEMSSSMELPGMKTAFSTQANLAGQLTDKMKRVSQLGQEINATQLKEVQSALDMVKALGEQVVKQEELNRANQETEAKTSTQQNNIMRQASTMVNNSGMDASYKVIAQSNLSNATNMGNQSVEITKTVSALETFEAKLTSMKGNLDDSKISVADFITNMDKLGNVNLNTSVEIDGVSYTVKELLNNLKDSSSPEEFEANLEKLEQGMSALKTQSNELSQNSIETLKQTLKDCGVDVNQVEQIVNNYTQALKDNQSAAAQSGESEVDLASKMGQLGEKAKKTKEDIAGLTMTQKSFSEIAVSFASTAMSISTLLNTISSSVSTLTDSSSSSLAKATALITILTTAIFTLNSVSKLGLNLGTSIVATETAKTAAYTAEGVAIEKTAAKAAELEAAQFSNVFTAIAAVVLMAVAAFIAYASAVESAKKAEAEAAATAATNAATTAKASKEESDAIKDKETAYKKQLKAYKEAKNAGTDTVEMKNSLIQAARDVTQAYDDETGSLSSVNTELAIAAGNYDLVTEAINRQRLAEVEKARTDAQLAKTTAGASLTKSMQVGENGVKVDDAGITYFKPGMGHQVNGSFYNTVNGYDQFSITKDWAGNSQLQMEAATSDQQAAEQYRQGQQLLQAAYDNAAKQGEEALQELINSEEYKLLTQWLEDKKDEYEAYTSSEKNLRYLDTDELILSQDEGSRVTGATDFSDYEVRRKGVVDSLQKDYGYDADEAETAASEYLAADTSTSAFEKTHQANRNALDAAESNTNSAWHTDKGKEALEDWYAGLSAEDKTLVAQIDFNSAQNTAALDKQLANLQEVAEVTPIKAKLDVANGLSSTYASKGAEGLKDEVDWGTDDIISYNEFLLKSKEEQIAYLETIHNDYVTQTEKECEEAKTAIDEEMSSMEIARKDSSGKMVAVKVSDFLSDENNKQQDGESDEDYKKRISITDDQLKVIQRYNNLMSERASIEQIEASAASSSWLTIKDASTIAKTLDSDRQKLTLLAKAESIALEQAGDDATAQAAAVKEYDEALLDVIKDSSQLSADAKLELLDSIDDETVRNTKEFKDAWISAVKESSSLSLDEKLAKINQEIGSGVENAELYGKTIAEIIQSDKNSTTKEKVAALQAELEAGKITAEQFRDAINGISDTNFGVGQKYEALTSPKKNMTASEASATHDAAYWQDWYNNTYAPTHTDESGAVDNSQIQNEQIALAQKEWDQAAVDSLSASDFSSLDEVNGFMERINAEGLEMKQLPAIYASLASGVSKLSDLTAIQNSERENGVDQTEALSIGLQTLGSKYSSCSNELKAYQAALASGNEEEIQATEVALLNSVQVAEQEAAYKKTATAVETLASNFSKYAQLGQKYKGKTALADIDSSDVSDITSLQSTFQDFFGVEEIGIEDTIKLASALGTSKEAFVQQATALGMSQEKAEKYYDYMQNIAYASSAEYYTSMGAGEGIKALNENLENGYIDAEKYLTILKELLGLSADVQSGAESFSAVHDKIVSNLNTSEALDPTLAASYKTSDLAQVGSYHQSTQSAMGEYETLRKQQVVKRNPVTGEVELDDAGRPIYENEFTDAEIDEKEISKVSSATDMSERDKLDWYTDRYQDVGKGSESAYMFGQKILESTKSDESISGTDKAATYKQLYDDATISAYQYIEAIKEIDDLSGKEKVDAIMGSLKPEELEQYSEELIDIIANDSTMTTKEKLEAINTIIEKGIKNASSLGKEIATLVNSDENFTASDGFTYLNQNKDKITAAGEKTFEEEHSIDEYGGDEEAYNQAREQAGEEFYQQTEVSTFKNIDFENMESMIKCYQSLDEETQQLIQSSGTLSKKVEDIVLNSSSLQDLQDNLDRAQEMGVDIDADTQAKALETVASQYDNCTEEIEAYKIAVARGTEAEKQAAKEALILSTRSGELAKQYGLDAEEVETYAKELKESGQFAKADAKELAEMSKEQLRYNKAVKTSSSTISDWKKELKSTGMASAATLNDIGDAYGNLLDIDPSTFSKGFLENTDNLELFQKAIDGDEDAYNKLLAAAKTDIESRFNLNDEQFQESKGTIDNFMSTEYPDIEVGASIDDSNFISACENIINQAGMTAQEAEDYLSSMGIDAEVVEDTEETPSKKTYTGAKAAISWQDVSFTNPMSGNPVTIKVPSIHYEKDETNVEDSEEMPATALKIKSMHKSSGGNVKKNNAGSSGRGRGGGGGSSRGRTRSDKRAVRYDASKEKTGSGEIERYHHITNSLQSMTHQLNMIAKAKDKAFGKDRLKAIDQETKALQKQKTEQEEYLKEIKAYAQTDAAAARSIGLEMDDEGNVTNYETKMAEWIDDYNDALKKSNQMQNEAVSWWNSLSASAQEKDENKDKYDNMVKAAENVETAASNEYESRKKILEQYEETMDLLDQEEETYQDILDSIRADMLEKIQYTVELNVEVSEDALNVLKDYIEDIGDDADGAADSLANFAKQAEQIQKQVAAYQEGTSKILGLAGADEGLINRGMSGKLTAEDWAQMSTLDIEADDVSTLEEYQQAFLEYNNTLRELRDSAIEKINTAFEEYNENLDKNSEKIEHLQTVNQTYLDIIDIVGSKMLDASGELTNALNEADFEMQRNNTHALKSQLEYQDEALAETKQLLEEAKAAGYDDSVIKQYEDQIESMQETRDDTYESWLDSWKAECEAAATIYEDTLENIVSDFEDAIAGTADSLTALQDAYDRQSTIDDTYLDEYDQIYQLSKLNRDINNSIDDTDNINSKKALKKLADEINKAQDSGNKLSQYDLDVLQKKYDLELAREQLEEARDNKTAVRMTRDSEGNFGYVYTADQDAVAEAEQNYEDKLYAMQQTNAEYIDNMQEQILQAEADCSSALSELNASDYATYEEYQAAAMQIQEDYGTMVQDYYDQLQTAIGNNKELYEGVWSDYSEATGYQLGDEEEFVTDFVDTQLSRLTDFETIADASQAFNTAVNDAVNSASNAWEEWYTTNQIALSDGGTTMQQYASKVEEVVNGDNGLVAQAQTAEEAANQMAEAYENAFNKVIEALKDFSKEWFDVIQKQIDQNQLYSTFIYNVVASAAGENSVALTTQVSSAASAVKDADAYDTGGYTGDWNSTDGKLAFLHAKELVLNADDTQNILDAVNSVRDISNAIDLNASAASYGLANALQSAGIVSNDSKETIEQNVQITAEFKDATTASEITAAFDNLINLASQYANRK